MAVYAIILVLASWLTLSIPEYIPPGPLYTCPKVPASIHPCVCEKGTDKGLYVRCENTGLATLSVGLGNIASLRLPMEKLVLKDCHISRLFGPLFRRSTVRVLHIEDTPLALIEADTFVGVNRTLQELHIIKSQLRSFPKQAVKILGNLSMLYIDGHSILSLDKDIFTESLAAGRIERLHIVNGNIEDIPSEPFQHLKKLKTLDLHGNRITTLKRSQFKGLRDTEVLDLSHNNITKLEGVHLGDLTKLGWLNVSHNNIGELTRGVFARNALLKVLHMNNNKLKKLDTNSFRGMRFLRRLFLEDNQISEVGRGTFSSILRIGTVQLARNFIKELHFQMFYELKYVEVVDVSSNQITSIDKQCFKDLYQATVNVSHNQLANIEPDAFINCGNLTVDFSHNNLTNIDRNAFDVNSYALEFQLSHNALTELNQIPLHNMTGLKVLNVSYNEIHTIPKATFPKLYELHTVDISNNKLKDIANSVFQTLFSLRFLNLSHNSLEQIKPSTMGTLPTVLELDLSHNQLHDVSRGSLAKLASCARIDVSHNRLERLFQLPISLGELNFSFNNLSSIPANTWPSMNALLRLNLSHNALGDSLNSESFRSLLSVLRLDLSANQITRPPWEALGALSSLQYVIMRDNQLTSLDKAAFGRLPTVFQLDLSNNQISSVSPRAFDGLLQLLDLGLSNNSLEHVPNEAFKTLVSLRKLDLSFNKLEKIDNRTHGLLDDCLSLEMVNLSHNYFSFLTRKMFPSDPYIPYKLMDIDLSYNIMPVLTGDIVYGTAKVKRLNLANNNINDIRKDVLRNLTSLEELDLSGNQLNDFSHQAAEEVFRLPDQLRILKLEATQLGALPSVLMKTEQLRLLDVRRNRLTAFPPGLVRELHRLTVLFEGNLLKCDCSVRPLLHYLRKLSPSQLNEQAPYNGLKCTDPESLANQTVADVDEDRLVCSARLEQQYRSQWNTSEFDLTAEPDVAFRDIQYSRKSIRMQWYVLSTNDIADFYIFVRDRSNTLYFNLGVSYVLRNLKITIDENQTLKQALLDRTPLEICLQAKNSEDFSRKWFQSQCKSIPENFESWPKYGRNEKSSALMLIGDSILITLCIFLAACFRKMNDFDA